jgi:phospholipid-translocating ATPase
LPLLIILLITALKDGYEDYKRHQSDNTVNYSKTHTLAGRNWSNPNISERKSQNYMRIILQSLRMFSASSQTGAVESNPEFDYDPSEEQRIDGPHWRKTSWEDLRVGDFVKISNNESIPADILICATSEEEDVAFVETKNLDGETNLKSRNAVPPLRKLRDALACANSDSSFQIQCDRPDTNMYRLNGNIVMEKLTSPVDLSMTLLRGTVLRNTKWVIGVVLFTGMETKIVLNSGGTPSKRSRVERQMNPQVCVVFPTVEYNC